MMDDQTWIVTIPFAAIHKRILRFFARCFHQDHLIVSNVSELLTADNCMDDALTFEVKANPIEKHVICHRSFMWLNSWVRIRSLWNHLNHFIRIVLFGILWLLCTFHVRWSAKQCKNGKSSIKNNLTIEQWSRQANCLIAFQTKLVNIIIYEERFKCGKS